MSSVDVTQKIKMSSLVGSVTPIPVSYENESSFSFIDGKYSTYTVAVPTVTDQLIWSAGTGATQSDIEYLYIVSTQTVVFAWGMSRTGTTNSSSLKVLAGEPLILPLATTTSTMGTSANYPENLESSLTTAKILNIYCYNATVTTAKVTVTAVLKARGETPEKNATTTNLLFQLNAVGDRAISTIGNQNVPIEIDIPHGIGMIMESTCEPGSTIEVIPDVSVLNNFTAGGLDLSFLVLISDQDGAVAWSGVEGSGDENFNGVGIRAGVPFILPSGSCAFVDTTIDMDTEARIDYIVFANTSDTLAHVFVCGGT